ncbi:Exodeoxyribonuclease 7 small subunit [Candidatus Hepatincolaceae symbiont of Richtersius coronifer]
MKNRSKLDDGSLLSDALYDIEHLAKEANFSVKSLENQGVSFEEAYNYLEKIISLQEAGNLKLEENIYYYKVGKILANYCTIILSKASEEIKDIAETDH